MLTLMLLACLLAAAARSQPMLVDSLESRQNVEKVQGRLGTDEYWNMQDGGLNNYTAYSGDGSSSSGWPARLEWIGFNDMWVINQHILTRSCGEYYRVPNNSADEIQALFDAIQTASRETRVDHRFILATVIQETKGCVRALTTVSPNGQVHNPGLLQDHDGTHTCNDNGKVRTPCPSDEILGMVMDGVAGTSKGKGIAGILASQNPDLEFAQAYYRTARVYNSGAVDPSGDLGKGSATHCYASDIANRMVGWVDSPSRCTLDNDTN